MAGWLIMEERAALGTGNDMIVEKYKKSCMSFLAG
jgi:hypothetical protein